MEQNRIARSGEIHPGKNQSVDSPGVAIYLRISRQDGDFGDGKDESNSIENQRKLLLRYIDEHPDLTGTVYEFRDDGTSGASFTSRPEFMKMIEGAKQALFDTILVKDFSRLGRDYIGVADYVERIFPLLGIRFISVNNHFDSGSAAGATMDLGLAIENLINTFYLQDFIKKQRTANEIRWKKGQATSCSVPFGYFWDRNAKRKWNLDPISSKYVRYIFDLAIEGNSTVEIAKVLNEEGIPTPHVYNSKRMEERTQEEQNLRWSTAQVVKTPKEEQFWTPSTVRKILRQYEYTGALVSNTHKRVKSPETGKYRRYSLPESEYIVAEGAHEAIVTAEEFEKAQKVIKSTGKRSPGTPREYPLKSKVRCGNCRRMLAYEPRSTHAGFFCCVNKQMAGELSGCSSEHYSADEINAIVLNAIERVISVAQVLEVKLESRERSEKEQGVSDIKHMETQIRVMKEERIRQYEGYADGMITRQEYIAVKAKIDKKIEELEADLDEARELLAEERRILEEIKGISRANLTGEEGTDAADGEAPQKPKRHVLTRALVEAFIDVIYVYDMEHIEIVFKCEDVMKKAMDRTSGGGRKSHGAEPTEPEPPTL